MTPGNWWNESGVLHAKHPTRWTEEHHSCCHPAEADIDEDAEGIAALRNTVPAMLDVLACFQEGDAHELDVMAIFFSIPREGMTSDDYQKWLNWASILARMQKAAAIMEEPNPPP
ncbi:MAG: hypothetical protein WC343_08625 [Bacilli bacterium]